MSAAVTVPAVEYLDPYVEFDVILSSSSLSVDHGHHVLVARRFTPARRALSPTDDVTLAQALFNSHDVSSIPARFLYTGNNHKVGLNIRSLISILRTIGTRPC